MKKFLVIMAMLASSLATQAQVNGDTTKTATDTTKFLPVDKLPEYPGGFQKFGQYIKNNLKYPKQAKTDEIQGQVIATFVVEKDGRLTDIHISKGISEEIDKEAIRLITNMPKWKPGTQNGNPVRVKYSVPIKFSLDN